MEIYENDITKNNMLTILKKLVKNKVYMICFLAILIAAFGFEITHFALGIDDFGVYHYMDLSPGSAGNMIQQGRLMHIIFFYILGLADVIPFLNNFIAALLFGGSAIALCVIIQLVTNEQFKTYQLLIFSGLYVSYSVISFKFIYDIDVVVTMFSYFCVPIAIYTNMLWQKYKRKKDLLISTLFLVAAIGSYEAFIAIFVCEVLFVLSIIYLNQESGVKELIVSGLKFAGTLTGAVCIYYFFVKIVQIATKNPPYSRSNLLTMGMTLRDLVQVFINRIVKSNLFFNKEFVCFAVVLVVLMFFLVIKRKKYFYLILFPALGFFTLFVSIIQGYVYYRVCLTFNIFIACVAMLVLICVDKVKVLRNLTVVIMSLVLVWQLKDINLWFYKDWVNYEKTAYAIHEIATELQRGYDVENKPVCFVNRDYESFLMTWDSEQQEIGEAPLISAVAFLGDATSPAVIELFKYQGYDFIMEPTEKQIVEAKKYSEEMTSYPKEGYIKEVDDYIIVNIGKNIQ